MRGVYYFEGNKIQTLKKQLENNEDGWNKEAHTPWHTVGEWGIPGRTWPHTVETRRRSLKLNLIPVTPWGGSPMCEPLNRLVSKTAWSILWNMRHGMKRLWHRGYIWCVKIMCWRTTHLYIRKCLTWSISSEAHSKIQYKGSMRLNKNPDLVDRNYKGREILHRFLFTLLSESNHFINCNNFHVFIIL